MGDESPPVPVEDAPAFRVPRRVSGRRLAASLALGGYAVEPGPATRHADLYFDTQDGALQRAGIRLRLRREGARWHLLERGWLVAEQGDGGEAPPGDGPVGAAIAALVGERRLLPQAAVHGAGHRWHVRTPVGVSLALDLERWSYGAPGDDASVAGVRVAFLEDPATAALEAQHLAAMLRDLVGLPRLPGDALALALAALELPAPGAPVPPELRLEAGDAIGEAARKILARQAYKMWANTRGTIADLDLEFLHDLRVATRRARSALRLLAPVVGPERADALRAELAWIAERLGAVRDLDVHLERLHRELERVGAAAGADAGFTAMLARRRSRGLAALRSALESRRYRALVAQLGDVRPAPGSPADPPVATATPAVEVAPDLIRRAARRVRRWSAEHREGASEAELHRLRILFKRLRYTCEFFAELFGDSFRAATARLVPFQDCLGAHQDAVVALAALAEYAGSAHVRKARDARGLLVLGALMQVQREEAAARRAELARLSKGLPKLLATLRRAGGPAGAAAPTPE